jgi:hypothetical protein
LGQRSLRGGRSPTAAQRDGGDKISSRLYVIEIFQTVGFAVRDFLIGFHVLASFISSLTHYRKNYILYSK